MGNRKLFVVLNMTHAVMLPQATVRHDGGAKFGLKVDFGEAYHGHLTRWTQQDRMLWEYYGKPCDSWSLVIQDIAVVDPVVPVHQRVGRRGRCAEASLGPHPLFSPAVAVHPSVIVGPNGPMSHQQLAKHWQVGPDVSWPCLWVPRPIMRLIRCRAWTSLMLSWSWDVKRFIASNWHTLLTPQQS